MRIVSLLPSATEIVCEIGLGDRLVGVSHECDYPAVAASLPKVTKALIPSDATSGEIDNLVRERLRTEKALYSLDLPMLIDLRPDLIVTQALCDVCAVAESEVTAALCQLPGSPRLVNLEPTCLEDVFECLQLVGDAAGATDGAREAVSKLRARVGLVENRSRSITHHPRTVLLEWIDPPFCSGHWTPELVRKAGGVECIGREGQASRTTAWDEVVQAAPEVMVVACCGFDIERTLSDVPILRGYPGFSDLPCVRSRSVYVVDGNAYFNRPGPRLVDSLEILAHILHPQLNRLDDPSSAFLRLSREALGSGASM
jgi:iron complex transport system substrate-binding protein